MLKLILPVIFPSWRFFSSIGPSPRIQFAFLEKETDEASAWQEFRSKPERVSFLQGLHRLLHNTQWNETLYISTCAERLFEEYSAMREQEIMQRILAAVGRGEITAKPNDMFLQFRISAIVREGYEINNSVVFVSKPVLLKGNL